MLIAPEVTVMKNESRTLPMWAVTWGLSIDATRVIVRRSPELMALGTRHGPVKVYSLEESEKIRTAFLARKSAKKTLEAVA